uniref:Uncharacterized protein n=1 Tax=Nelumbo nucifera TaxID=4432 RepID=A0A822Z9G5_NELNU|nr:TPA_asm: hypothetical protein HUJ06_016015 [Nelumbo nucifera]
MAFAHHSLAMSVDGSNPPKVSIFMSSSCYSASSTANTASLFSNNFSSSLRTKTKERKLSLFSRFSKIALTAARAKEQESETSLAADAFTNFKHLLLPITDRNPYLSDGTRQATATTAALAKKYGADITVVVIDEKPKELFPEHDTQLSSIRWHLSQGWFLTSF